MWLIRALLRRAVHFRVCRLQRAAMAALAANACTRTAVPPPTAANPDPQGGRLADALGSLELGLQAAAPAPFGLEQGLSGHARTAPGPGQGPAPGLLYVDHVPTRAPLDVSGSEALALPTGAACSPAPGPSAPYEQRSGSLADQGSRSAACSPGAVRFAGRLSPGLGGRLAEPGPGRSVSGPACERSVAPAFAAWQALTVQQWRARGAVAAPMIRQPQWR